MTFPLPLSPFERQMHIDDREKYPMAFHIRLRLSGNLDVEAFHRSVEQAVKRHPLLQARVEGTRLGKAVWVETPDPTILIDIAPLDEPLRYPNGRERINLEEENGLRVWARHGDGRVMLNFQFHHACGDGIGAYRLIEDVFAIYDQAMRPGQTAGELRPIDPEQLKQRTAFGMVWWKRWLRLPIELWGVVIGMLMFFNIKPTDLPTPEEPELSDDDAATVLDMPIITLDVQQYKLLREAARRVGATVNDILLRDTLLAFHKWVMKYDPDLKKRYLRIMIPVNLRGENDEAMPCTNVVGMVFLDRVMTRYKTPKRLLVGIKLESLWLKRLRFGMTYNLCCKLLPFVMRGGLSVVADAKRSYATSALSNMGRVFYGHKLRTENGKPDGRLLVGEMMLEGVESAPPVRNKSSTSLTALSYNGSLTIVVNYDRRHFTPETARELTDLIAAEHQRTIDEMRNPQEPAEPPLERALVD